MSSPNSKMKGSLFASALTPFDLFCDGNSYGEIVEETGLDLFTVMAEIAKEATVHAGFRSINPYVEQEYQISQLHRVVSNAWATHNDMLNAKGTELATIVQAVRGISQILRNGPAAVPGTEDKPQLPAGLTPEVIAMLGALQVKSRFGQAPLVGINGGKKE